MEGRMAKDQQIALPDNLEACHVLIGDMSKEISLLNMRLEVLRRRLFGRSSEKMAAAELEFFGEPLAAPDKSNDNNIVNVSADVEPAAAATPSQPAAKPAHGGGRKPLPADLPRLEIRYELPPERLEAENLKLIRQEVSEQLEYTPSSLLVLRHVQSVYGSRDSLGSVVTAPKPPQPIEKSIAGPGLIAHIIVSKYNDHSPLYRQEGILARHGVDLSRSTQCDLAMTAAESLAPISQAMRLQLLLGGRINTDDTPVPVQTKEGHHTARLWTYVGDHRHPFNVFDFTWTRAREGPRDFLGDYGGILQADAYGGYDEFFEIGADGLAKMTESGCMAHARRYFFDAKDYNPVIALEILGMIRKLYDIERDIKDQWPVLRQEAPDPQQYEEAAQQRHAIRQEKSRALWETLGERLRQVADGLLPKSPIAKAVSYTLNHWTALGRFLENGLLEIDNNAAERAIRPLCLGKKNWLHLGSRRGGRAAAVLFSLVSSARRHGIDPFLYLRDLLVRINTHPHTRIRELLPDQWKLLFQAQAQQQLHALRNGLADVPRATAE
jgi:transposase